MHLIELDWQYFDTLQGEPSNPPTPFSSKTKKSNAYYVNFTQLLLDMGELVDLISLDVQVLSDVFDS